METLKKDRNNFPPSTELIPDEYDVVLDGRECVHIFVDSSFVENCRHFLGALKIKLPVDHIHKLDNHRKVLDTLEKVAKASQKDKILLLLIFWGHSSQNGQISLADKKLLAFHEIWSKFCIGHWRNRPKVFLFNMIKYTPLQVRDSQYKPEEFETPNEGDVLIVFKNNMDSEESETFIKELGETFVKLGRKEDFSSIVTAAGSKHQNNSRPILITTMLKKLYLLPSEDRGHHLILTLNNDHITREMANIQKQIKMLQLTRFRQHSKGDDGDDMATAKFEQSGSAGRRRTSSIHVDKENSSRRKSMEAHSRPSLTKRKNSDTKKEPWHYC